MNFEMMETAEILMNAVNVSVKAYFVPWLAHARFEGSMDQLNRSYEGVAQVDGGAVVPFVETHAKNSAATVEEIYKYLGEHASEGDQVATFIREAYNLIWNFRAKNRSPNLTSALLTNEDLLPAFWGHQQFRHIVPDFDQAVIDGEVALNIANAKMPVKGMGLREPGSANSTGTVLVSGGETTTDTGWKIQPSGGAGSAVLEVFQDPQNLGFPDIYSEMQQNGITVSLSNIELARKTQAFAKIKEQYQGLDDEYIIDLLMDGISVPDQALKQPILLADKSNVFGMQKRYASDAANLAESAVNGATFIDLSLRLPRMSTGGTIMIVAEITPEQMFERQKNPYFHLQSVDELPQYLRDTLDPEKVEVVKNDMIDVDHNTPADTFGYAPLNWRWNSQIPKIGGKFYRPDAAAGFDEDRQRLWVVETANPTLSDDFYLCTHIHTDVFQDTLADPFECTSIGAAEIIGNTVFGSALIEATSNYDEVMAEADQSRIEK